MKQVTNVNHQRQKARDVSREAVKFDKNPHAFSFPRSGVSFTEPRNWVRSEQYGPGILSKDMPTSETDPKK